MFEKQSTNKLPTATIVAAIALVVAGGGAGFARPLVLRGLYRLNPPYALGMGAGAGDAALIEDALRHGADINGATGYQGRTPLMIAALHHRDDAMQLLLRHGANADLRDDTGRTARDLAGRGRGGSANAAP